MCVMMHPVRMAPSGTKLYGGMVDHPIHGRIHVIGYSNDLVNTYGGANCMIIHIPAGEEMTRENFLNPDETSEMLSMMSRAVFPPPRRNLRTMRFGSRLIAASSQPVVQHFAVGDYDVLLADDPEAIPGAFEKLSPEKRPVINEEIFSWYKENARGWPIALFCFNAKEINAKPVFYWYKPLEGHEDYLRLPAIDSHDGTPPRLGEPVHVNHELFVSWPGMDGIELDYGLSSMKVTTRSFMPTEVAGVRIGGSEPNGDFGVDVGIPTSGLIRHDDVRRLSLPGSKVRF